MLDLPGIIEGAKDGKGRGRQVIAVARTCSLIFIVLDVLKPLQHKRIIEREVEGFGIRLNKTPPNIAFKKKDKGGINMAMQVWIEPLLYWRSLLDLVSMCKCFFFFRFLSRRSHWSWFAPSSLSTRYTMLTSPFVVTPRQMTSSTSWRETGMMLCVA